MFVLSLMQRGLGLLAITILARLLDSQGLGAYAFTQSVSQTFYGLSRLGVDWGIHVGLARLPVSHDKSRAQALIGEGLTIFLLIAFGIAGVMTLLAPAIAAHLFAAPDLTPYMGAAAAVFASQALSQYCYTVHAGLNSFAVYARMTLFGAVCTLVLVIVGAIWHGALGSAWGLAIAQGLTLCLVTFGLRNTLARHGLKLRPRWPAAAVRDIFRLGLPFYASGLLVIPVEFLSLSFLGRTFGVGALGELRVTQALMSVATVLPTAFFGPMVTHLAERHAAGIGFGAVLTQLKVIWILASVLAVGLAAVWPLAVDIVFGGSFPQARSIGSLAIAAFIPTLLLSVLQGALLAERRSGALFWIGGAQALALGVAAWLMIARFGLAGYFMAQALGMWVGVALTWLTFGRGVRPPLWMASLAVLTVGIIALIGVDAWIDEPLALRLAVVFGVLALAAAVAVTVLAPAERTALIALARQVRARLSARLGLPIAPSDSQ